MPPLLSCHLRRSRHGLARPLSGSAYHPAQVGASPSGSSPGSSPYGPGRLIDPGAPGHLRSPLDGAGYHLSWGSDEPMLKGYFGGTRCRTGSCRSGSRQGESKLPGGRPRQQGDDEPGGTSSWKREHVLIFWASIAISPSRPLWPPSSLPAASELSDQVQPGGSKSGLRLLSLA
jgi:hypothetical protein